MNGSHPATGTVSPKPIQRKHGAWNARMRAPNGQQVQRLIGPAKSKDQPDGLTRKQAQSKLREMIVELNKTPAPVRRTGHTFKDAADEWLRYTEHERDLRVSTMRDYRSIVDSTVLPHFKAETSLHKITQEMIENWQSELLQERARSKRTIQKHGVALHGILERAKKKKWMSVNPMDDMEGIDVDHSARSKY